MYTDGASYSQKSCTLPRFLTLFHIICSWGNMKNFLPLVTHFNKMIFCDVCNIGQGSWLWKKTESHSSYFKQKEFIQWWKQLIYYHWKGRRSRLCFGLSITSCKTVTILDCYRKFCLCPGSEEWSQKAAAPVATSRTTHFNFGPYLQKWVSNTCFSPYNLFQTKSHAQSILSE